MGRWSVQFDSKLLFFCVSSWAFLVFCCQDVRPQSSLGGGGSRFLKKAPPPPAVNSTQSPISKIRMQQVPEPRYSSVNSRGTNVVKVFPLLIFVFFSSPLTTSAQKCFIFPARLPDGCSESTGSNWEPHPQPAAGRTGSETCWELNLRLGSLTSTFSCSVSGGSCATLSTVQQRSEPEGETFPQEQNSCSSEQQ